MDKNTDFYLPKSLLFFNARILESEMFTDLPVKIYIFVFIVA